MKIRYFIFVAVLTIAFLCFGGVTKVQAADNSALIAQLQAQIASLMAQLQALQAQRGTITPATPTAWCHAFNTNLGFANSGITEVGDLKTALIKNGVWPYEAVTYDYDEETAAYVVKFQTKYGILASGYVGPLTRAKLNALYRCTQPSITVTSPNGGEQQQIGQTYNVKWTKQGSFPANVGYVVTLLKGGQPLYAIASSYKISGSPFYDTSGNQYYSWQIPDAYGIVSGNDYKIEVKIMTADGLTEIAKDQSDSYFTIAPASTQPLSVSCVGQPYAPSSKITWTGQAVGGSGTYTYQWSAYGDVTGYTGGSTKSASFTASYGSAGYKQAVIRVSDGNTTVSANCATTISSSSITVTSPNGGEVLTMGQTYNVTWQTNLVGNVGIDLVNYTNGVRYRINSINTLASSGSYAWNISNSSVTSSNAANILHGNMYKIQIYNDGVVATSDYSDDYFTLTSDTPTQPSITVTAPNGGETWMASHSYTIKWMPSGDLNGLKANVDLYTPGKAFVKNIGFFLDTWYDSSHISAYYWPIAQNESTGTYLIRVYYTDSSGKLVAEKYSDRAFTITPPMVSTIQQSSSASILDAMPSWLKLILQGYVK